MLVDFGEKYHDKFLSTFGTGLTDSMLTKLAKMLFDYQLKTKIFREQMDRIAALDHSSGLSP